MPSGSKRGGQRDGIKNKIAGHESPKLKKKSISSSKIPKAIQTRTKNNSLDNASRRSLLTLQRAAGKKCW